MINIKNLFIPIAYLSGIDELIIEFDKKNPKLAPSQRAEKEKYAGIYYLRDTAEREVSKVKWWENF